MYLVKRYPARHRRRASALIQVVACSTLIVGMGALVVDIGAIYTAQTELQVAADAAALAAASQLANFSEGDPEDLAYTEAQVLAQRYQIDDKRLRVEPGDVAIVPVEFDTVSGKYTVTSSGNLPGVNVTMRRTEDTDTIELPLVFAGVFNRYTQTIQADATAVLLPRDIAVVIDLSRSMLYDSSLMYWNRNDGGASNLHDVWCALVPGQEPAQPYDPLDPRAITGESYSSLVGPQYGYMTEWGDELDPNNYNASSDPGLFYVRRYYDTNESGLTSRLAASGYNNAEIDVLLSGDDDGDYTRFKNRCGILLGLADWHSGLWDGDTPPAHGGEGGNARIDDGEVAWSDPPDFAVGWNWKDYIHYQQGNGYRVTFRYRYGPKTFTHFLMMEKPYHSPPQGDEYREELDHYHDSADRLWATPQQPLRAVKDAVRKLTNVIYEQQSLDQMSLALYSGWGWHETNLTEMIHDVPDQLDQFQAGHNDLYTNIGGGMYHAIHHLRYSENARNAAAKFIVLMSDGVPNRKDNRGSLADIDELDPPEVDPEYWSNNADYARSMARIAKNNGMYVYTVSVGYSADENLMAELAELGGGEHFHSEGNPQEYTAQLEEIFSNLGTKRPVTLIE